MQRLLRTAVLSAGLIAAAGDAGAVDYVQAPPLASVVKTGVAACTGKEALQLPIITWGGDIATVFANGNQAETARGSLFEKAGLRVRLAREDVLAKQLESYLACRTPFLRGTLGMLGQVAEVTERDPRTSMVLIYQLTWSAGGDALVVKGNINQPADLRGKTIALQAYGPHLDYLARVLRDAGLSLKDVKLRWVKDLTGTNQLPRAAFREPGIDAAMLIIPDALALTSGGKVGTGAEESVRGAKVLLSTKTANRVIADFYAVRADYLAANRAAVEKLVQAMLAANEQLAALFKKKGSNDPGYRAMIQGAARLLLDSPDAVPDTEAMYGDATFAGLAGNVAVYNDARNPRSLAILGKEVDEALIGAGLRTKPLPYAHAKWNFDSLKGGLSSVAAAESPRFNAPAVAQVATRRTQQGGVAEGQLFTFEVQFKPNQDAFTVAQYEKDFDRAVNLAATYGGAVITIEGHADPLAFLQRKKAGETEVVLGRIRQAAKNLSFTRANGVRDGLIKYGKDRGVVLDASQFVVVGHGIEKPKNGLCAGDPCAPKNEPEWLANMRVEFRIIQVEAEASVFRRSFAAVICMIGLLAGASIAMAQRAPWPPQGPNVPVAPNPTARNYYVVLDGSGSMSEASCRGAGTKMEQAREALIGFASSVPKEANVGLLVFDARGIREVVPLGGADREPFLRAVRAASPGGLTPLHSAITMARSKIEFQARRQLGYGEYHLVVVTDGEASRYEDPRGIVDSIIATTPIVLHTIGFCIDARHSLNQPGRILYRQANDREELRKGLQNVLAEAPSFTVLQFGTVAPGKAGR